MDNKWEQFTSTSFSFKDTAGDDAAKGKSFNLKKVCNQYRKRYKRLESYFKVSTPDVRKVMSAEMNFLLSQINELYQIIGASELITEEEYSHGFNLSSATLETSKSE